MRVNSSSRSLTGFTGFLPVALVGLLAALGCGGGGGQTTNPPVGPPVNPPVVPPVVPPTVDESLREALATDGMYAPAPPAAQDPAQVELGRMLFFDKILSTRGDISCSGCHHPTLQMADSIPLSKGTNGEGLGPNREIFDGQTMVARNATDVFNRGLPSWRTMLWDSRVEQLPNGQIRTPAGAETPSGLSGVLAAQAIMAMADDREMHADQMMFVGGPEPGPGGMPPQGDSGNEQTLTQIWANITQRVTARTGYGTLLAAAYPNTPLEQITISNLANAIAAFETEKLTTLDTPFDRYLRGDDAALTLEQKNGAILFYGKANCSSCHAGELMTDQKPHNLMIPELGPGTATTPNEDRGRMDVTGDPADNYGFRTPPLRNVSQTGPWMHNGAIGTLEDVVRHHLDPKTGFIGLDTSHLPADLAATVKNTIADQQQQEPTVDPAVAEPLALTDQEVNDLVKFLDSLTDVSLADKLKDLEPVQVPSNIDPGYGGGGHDF